MFQYFIDNRVVDDETDNSHLCLTMRADADSIWRLRQISGLPGQCRELLAAEPETNEKIVGENGQRSDKVCPEARGYNGEIGELESD